MKTFYFFNMTPVSSEAEASALFSNLLLYYFNYIQKDKISSEQRNKQGDNQNPVNNFLGAGQDDQNKRTATHASAETALSFALTQTLMFLTKAHFLIPKPKLVSCPGLLSFVLIVSDSCQVSRSKWPQKARYFFPLFIS